MKFAEISPKSDFEVVAGNARSQAAIMVLAPDTTTGGPDNKHHKSDQWLFVMSGNGLAIVSNKELVLKSGSLLLIEAGESHEIKNNGKVPLETLNFYCPPEY